METAVTLSGKASKGQKVDVLDGINSKGQATADPVTGIWTLPVSGLSATLHSFTAKALYGSGVESAARTFTVAAQITPTLTTVTDSKGPVPEGGTTVDTALTLSGKASKNQRVEVLDHGVSQGSRPVDGNGDWTTTGFRTTVGAHSITIRGVYGNPQPVSEPPRTFTVAAVVPPTISSVTGSPSGVDIPQGGTTVETAVTLSGKASNGLKVQILDGAVEKGDAIADPISGIWIKKVTDLSVAPHSFTAKPMYGNGVPSAARTFTVTSGLIVDTTPLVLNGANISIAGTTLTWTRRSDPAGTVATRPATGGRPPYTYETSNALVASVDGNGVVRSTGNGTATITVRDSADQSKVIPVTASNVQRLTHNSNRLNYDQYLQWAASLRAHPLPATDVIAFIILLNFTYVAPPWDLYNPRIRIALDHFLPGDPVPLRSKILMSDSTPKWLSDSYTKETKAPSIAIAT
ncbi:hypothetical protein V466_17005 [Pseudomonas mandelii PD30]|uniref:BIG2 domain-containing protein n=1 Tax=Pseudomonas mandelii PD30 TaxID=1419583 RepID=A0A059L0K0_9PSED|nr:hypothetical protein [Pseudomonas mandelii]KDD67842.1 hypothetical protein V466_17005 [Pseudomonas mandelii PD30]